ncbi:hypothetical protein GCM10009827_074120 [Dactylosporangium maewongense]|uniref:Aminoglycoside-2''-adenylyltransferase n=1 Tax=Dactylosporangium maewongense TaxID=634393 RepID=A0ABN2BNI8_9ACTN
MTPDRWARCWTPAEVARRLTGVTQPWYVAGGWALDLFRGEQTREHHDIEIGVPAGRFAELRFPGLVFDAVGGGQIWEAADQPALDATRQTWLRDPATGDYLVDVFREPHDGDTWIYRRDETVRYPYSDIIRHTADGVPYLIPELVLLFKAKELRPKDQADFDAVLPLLGASQRRTLAGLLAAHPWRAALP